MRKPLVIAGLLTLAGCGSYKDDVATICESPSKSGVDMKADPATNGLKLAQYISAGVKSQRAKDLLRSFATMPSDQKIQKLREEGKSAGLAKCELADFFDEMDHPK